MTVIWVYWPVLGTLQLSLYEWNLLPTRVPVWLGLDNYRQLLNQPELNRALVNTGLYVLGLVPFSIALPLLVALLLRRARGAVGTFYRGVIFLPVLMAPVVVAVIWRWILSPNHGIGWLLSPSLALWAIVLITGWKLLGFSTLILSAGLTNINREYFEAAEIDGATALQRLRYILLPLLSPTLLFMLLLTVLLASQWTFPIINALTQGGPRSATTNAYYILWQFGFQTFNVGLSSAAGVLFFGGFLVVAIGVMRLIDRYSFFDA